MDQITAANVQTAVELDHKHDAEITGPEKVAITVNDFAGSVSFIIVHLVAFSLWIGVNGFLGKSAFDAFPFTLLNLFVSLESIFLSSLLLISQNRISKQQDTRHQLDLQINLLAEQENTLMLRVLERIGDKLEIDTSELQPYVNDTKPEEILEGLENHELNK